MRRCAEDRKRALSAQVQALLSGREATSTYDGYTACPVLLGAAWMLMTVGDCEALERFGFMRVKWQAAEATWQSQDSKLLLAEFNGYTMESCDAGSVLTNRRRTCAVTICAGL